MKEEIAKEFKIIKPAYERLGNNIVDALKTFLGERDIPYVDIYHRVKGFDSFYEKIDRKKYDKPFEQIEDICGVRVVCYFASDIERINEIIRSEFVIIEEQNKEELLGLKEFAYRSQHYIAKINETWLAAPNYRGLNGLKTELQIRTILMHAWAEIEHKLNYKSDAQVPDVFQRKLFRLSAKLEESDEQFEELKNGIKNYRDDLRNSLELYKRFDLQQSLNLDSFLVFLDFCFSKGNYDTEHLEDGFDRYSKLYKNYQPIYDAVQTIAPFIDEISNDLLEAGYSNDISLDGCEIIGVSIDICDKRNNQRLEETVEAWTSTVFKWRKIANK